MNTTLIFALTALVAARQAILDSVAKDGLAKVQTVAYFPDEDSSIGK